MDKFKIPSMKSFRNELASRVSQGKGNKDALTAVDYSLEHPSSPAHARAQIQRAKAARRAAAKKVF